MLWVDNFLLSDCLSFVKHRIQVSGNSASKRLKHNIGDDILFLIANDFRNRSLSRVESEIMLFQNHILRRKFICFGNMSIDQHHRLTKMTNAWVFFNLFFFGGGVIFYFPFHRFLSLLISVFTTQGHRNFCD